MSFHARILTLTLLTLSWPHHSFATPDHQYLFIGHPRDNPPGEIVQPELERVDYSAYDMLLLGGDYTWRSTSTRATVNYLDAVFNLSSPDTLATLGNHDMSNKSFFTDVTGRDTYYAYEKNNISFFVLDTTDNNQHISGTQLTLLLDTINNLTTQSHLVLVHHHFIWLADYAPLAHLIGSPKIGGSSNNINRKNFHDSVYPLLVEVQNKGIEVICIAGDRTGTSAEEFYIDYTTAEGVRFIGAGLKETLAPTLRTVVVLEHDTTAETLTPVFQHLSDLPTIPDENVLLTEIHYQPSVEQGADYSYLEFFNRGRHPYDLSFATFSNGLAFTFPDNTFLNPGQSLVLANDPTHYEGQGKQVIKYSGDTPSEIGSPLTLRNAVGQIIDSVSYQSSGDWPSSPNGNGPSLSLINYYSENSSPNHWTASDQNGGTPGDLNYPLPDSNQTTFLEGEAQLSWSGIVTGATYQLEYSSSLLNNDWHALGETITASDTTLVLPDPGSPGTPYRFYRLKRLF